MNLQKRDCNVKMKIVPYGGGWTDVYMDFGEEELYFIISYALGNNLTDFMQLLYCMYPEHKDSDEDYGNMDYYYAVSKSTENGYVTDFITDDRNDIKPLTPFHYIPWKADLEWNEEGSCSNWSFERKPNEDTEFLLHIDIHICRDEEKSYHYEVAYKEFCYAFAKAYTEMIKKHGFLGYHRAVYSEDIHMRYLLFFKAYALDCLDVIKITHYEEKGEGERSSLENELELLMFDM